MTPLAPPGSSLPPLPPQPPGGGPPPAWEPEAPPVPWAPLPEAEPAWPKALGITAIVFGAYGMISHAAGFASSRFLGAITKGLPEAAGFDEQVLGLMNRYMLYNGTGCLILGLLLLAGGIALLRRRRKARALLLTWAMARIVLAVATLPLMMSYTEAMMARFAVPPLRTVPPAAAPPASGSTPASPPPAAGTPRSASAPPAAAPAGAPGSPAAPPFNVHAMAAAMSRIGAYAGLASACLGPVFALIWFNLRRIRTQMASWPAKPAPRL